MALVAGSRADVTVDVNGTDESRRRIESVGDAMSGLGGRASALHETLGAIGALAAVTVFATWVKGAIDATDAASDLSQKTGVAIQDLAGLELAYQMGGMEAGAFASSQVKLSKAIVDGNETLKALGISAKNLDGTLKSNKEVLYSVADSFASMEDGAQKTALAVGLFGKSGADMIPMLNGGSEGLREMDDMARRLGLTLDEEAVEKAGAFNDTLDLMMLGGQGVARGIAAELLPTLSSLAGSFLTTMTQGDRLKNTAQFLANVLKILYTVGVGVVEVFSTVGKTLGAAGAQLIAILSGDFKTAAQIGREWADDIGEDWSNTAKAISDAWSTSGNSTVDTMAKITRSSTTVGQSAAEVKKQTAEANKERTNEAKILAELSGVTATYMEDLSRLNGMRAKGKVTEEQYIALVTQLIAKQPGAKKAMDDAAKATADYEKATHDARTAVESEIEAILEQSRALETKVATYGLLPEAITAVQIAELEASQQSLALTEQGIADIQRKVDALRRLQAAQRAAQQQVTAGDAAKKLAEDGKRAADSIENSLTDALMRGFESGKGFAENLVDTVKNTFNTMVLRPIVSAIVNPVAGAVSGALGFGGTASAATVSAGGSSAASGLGMSALGATVGSYFGAGGIAGSVAAGAGWVTGATTLGGSLTAAGSLAATGTLGGIASSLGMVVGALGPIALGIGAAVAIWKKFDTSGTYHAGGAAMATSAGVSAVSAASLNMERIQTNGETQKLVSSLASGVVSILDSTALAFGKSAGYQAATAFADDTSKDGAWGSLVISKLGQSIVNWQDTRGNGKWAQKTFADGQKGQEQYLAALTSSVRTALNSIGLPEWARTMLNGVASDASLDELAKVVDQINKTQAALGAMRSQLVGFNSMSDEAVSALMAASGGIDTLFSNAGSYFDSFYSEAEKNATLTAKVADALAAVNLQMPTSRDGYRALLEEQMKLGAEGAEAAAVLLNLNQAFAQLHPEVEQTAAAARSAADILNESRTLQDQLDKLTMSSAQLRAKERLAIDETNRALWDQVQAAQAAKEAQDAARSSLGDIVSRMKDFNATAVSLKDELNVGSLSTFTMEQQLAEARRQYERTKASALAGDERAQANIGAALNTWLGLSQKVNGGDAQYVADMANAQRDLATMEQWSAAQVDVAQASLDQLNAQTAGLTQLNNNTVQVLQAVQALPGALSGGMAMPIAIPAGPQLDFSRFGTTDMAAVLSELKATRIENMALREEVRGLRADVERNTGAHLVGVARATHDAADKVVGALGRRRATAESTSGGLDK